MVSAFNFNQSILNYQVLAKIIRNTKSVRSVIGVRAGKGGGGGGNRNLCNFSGKIAMIWAMTLNKRKQYKIMLLM